MSRSNILARELRGTLVVLLVAALMVSLFSRLNNDRLDAQEERALTQNTTTTLSTSSTTTTIATSDNERLCSLATGFRADLSDLGVSLVDNAGDTLEVSDDPAIDIGLHEDGDIEVEVPADRTVAGEEAFANGEATNEVVDEEAGDTTPTTEAPLVERRTPPFIIDTEQIDPLASGLLGEPQEVALNFYTTAAILRLGAITADFAAASDYFNDFVEIGGGNNWDLEELAQSDFNDQWIALSTGPVRGVDATLGYIEEQCSVRIGNGFVYREEAPELEVVEPVIVETPVDPGSVPTTRPPATTVAPAPAPAPADG